MKHDLISNIIFLQDHLLSEGVSVEKLTKKKLEGLSEDELKKLTEKLETMVDDVESEETSSDEIVESAADTPKSDNSLDEDLENFMVRINKGVNVEMTIANSKQIFASEQQYSLSKDDAKTLVDEKLGVIVSE